MNGWFPGIFRLSGLTAAATPVNLDTEPVLPGELWEVVSGSANNLSGEPVTLAFYVVSGTEVIQISANVTVATGDAWTTVVTPLLMEGQKFRVSIKGVALSGPVMAFITAKRRFFPPAATPVTPLAGQEALEE